MNNPWKDNDAAFSPMFCDVAVFYPDGSLSGKVDCCAFPMESVDPFAEGDNVSEVRSVTLLVRKSDWTLSGSVKPATGDKFTLEDGLSYKVQTAVPEQNWWKIVGRSST